MVKEQIASAYAISKVLGCELSLDEFEKQYSQYYEEFINELNSRPTPLAQTTVFKKPF